MMMHWWRPMHYLCISMHSACTDALMHVMWWIDSRSCVKHCNNACNGLIAYRDDASPVLELSNFRWGGWVFESPDQLAAERNLPIIIQQGRNHASKVGGVWIGRSPNRGREAPEIWGRSPNRGRSPRKSGGRGLGRGLGEPLPRKFLEFRTSNRSIWCIVERGIRK